MPRATLRVGARHLEYAGTVDTQVFLILGHPVAHSWSPVFQSAALRALGLDAVYLAADIAPAALPAALADLRTATVSGRLGGANVTVPHKRAVLPFLDELDDDARQTGAVNTIVCTPAAGRLWTGANTDVEGLRRSLDDAGVSLGSRPVVVVGAGGMARAAVAAAVRAGAPEVRVAARDARSATALWHEVAAASSGSLPRFVASGLDAAAARLLEGAGLLVQATSLGLGASDPSPLGLEAAPPDLFVFEAIYNPPETALLRAARARGLRCCNGLGMLVHQGAQALHRWTGADPPLAVMRRSVGLD